MKSYLTGRYFSVKYNNSKSHYYCIGSGVPQRSVLGPLLSLLHTAHIPESNNTTLAAFADDVAVISVNEINPIVAS